MQKPPVLKPGDRIAALAPASPFDRADFERGLAELRTLDLEPVYDDRVFASRAYVAGDPRVRAEAFLDAWRDPAIAGIVGVRGGYGSVQLLALLEGEALARTPKIFIGHSDLTALLAFLTITCGITAVHGPMVVPQFARGAAGYDRESFRRTVMSAAAAGEFAPPDFETIKEGEAAGVLMGGTLTQLAGSLGTPFAFSPPKGFVLFVDEVGERPYRVDRLLTQLRLAGVLARASGIVFGELPRCDEPNGLLTARMVVADLLRDFPGPVVFGFPSGHTSGPCWTLPVGVRARIVARGPQPPRLVVEEAAVA